MNIYAGISIDLCYSASNNYQRPMKTLFRSKRFASHGILKKFQCAKK